MSALQFDRVTETVFGKRVDFRRLTIPVGEFVYEGRVDGGNLEMWTEYGRWREDSCPHHFDLVMVKARSAEAAK
jgi:hypothetical protein